MGRWAPDARERLEAAALDLFAEQGFDATTVAQIADRAGLNRATFFRHFADKREVLFAGEDVLAGRFAGAVRAADPDATPTECLEAALSAAGEVMTPEQRMRARRRIQVMAAQTEQNDLQERGRLKHDRIAGAVAGALRERGADELTARLAADVGLLAFRVAFERWMQAPDGEPFAPHAVQALKELRERAAALSAS